VRSSLLALSIVVVVSSTTSRAHASSIDRELIRRVLVTASPALAECGLPVERYVVRLVVEGDGRVSDVRVSEPIDVSHEKARCVVRAFERVVFPAFEPPRPPSNAPRPGEPRSHLPPVVRRVGSIVIHWPFVVRAG
jgi:hypothetical protein